MARSKDKFFKLLEAKGIDRNDPAVSEFISDFDGDFAEMNKFIEENSKLKEVNDRWGGWYQQKGYRVDELEQENAAIKQQLDRIRAAGVTLSDDSREAAHDLQSGQAVTPEALEALKREIFGTFSSVTKDLLTIQGEHFKQFGEVPDLEAIEKIVGTENIPVRAAYDKWVAPKREARQKDETEKEIKRRVEEALRDERSKMGVAPRKKQSDAVSPMQDYVSGNPREARKPKGNVIDRMNQFITDMNSVEPDKSH